MPRIKVTRLRKFCGLLAGHSWQQAERVALAARDLVARWLPPDVGDITLLDFQLYLAELLDSNRVDLTSADNFHLHELAVDRTLRQERAAATAEVREKVLQLRDSLDGLYGPGGSAKIFEEVGPTPADPVALVQYTGHALDNLRNEDFPLPTPLQRGFTLDRPAAVSDVEGPYQRLVEVLRQLESTQSDSKFSQGRKDDSVSVTETFAFKVARFYEALYALVGLDGLASRVRKSTRTTRAGGDPGLPEDDGDAGETLEIDAEVPGEDVATPTPVAVSAG